MWINEASVRRCHGKIGYWNPSKAEGQAKRATEKSGEWIIAYQCLDCGLWHIGHPDPCQFALIKQRLCKGCREPIPEGRGEKEKFCTDQCKLDHVARKANAVMLCGDKMYVPSKPSSQPVPVPVAYTKTGRLVVAEVGNRPVYEPSVDLSEIKQYTRGAITKQEKKAKSEQENNLSTSHIPPDLVGVKFGRFTVLRRIKGKWEVECECGAIDHRSSKAVLNPSNTFDCCEECRKPLGELRSKIHRETGVDVLWEDCFQQIYGDKEDLWKSTEKNTKLELT
jgi:hypothetical protein